MLNDGWAIVCQLGLWGWIVSTVAFIATAFPARGRFELKPAVCWGGALALFFTIWIIGMAQA